MAKVLAASAKGGQLHEAGKVDLLREPRLAYVSKQVDVGSLEVVACSR